MTRNPARLGGPIVLSVLGLILALAVRDSISQLDLTMIGWIMAAAGLVWLLLELLMGSWAAGPRTLSSSTVDQVDPNTGARYTETRQDLD